MAESTSPEGSDTVSEALRPVFCVMIDEKVIAAADMSRGRRVGPKGAAAMPTSRTKRSAAAALAALTLVLTAACSSSGGGKTTSAPRAEVLAVKIDNVAAARPPTGLEKADIVYVEQVEAGLSRILAAYSSDLPSVVGPVRSARETDLELLRQFDEPTLAYSGAQSALRPSIEAAPSTRCRRRRHRAPISATRIAPHPTISICARGRSRAPPPGRTRPRTSGSASLPRPRAVSPSASAACRTRRHGSPSPGPRTGTSGW